MTLDGQQLIKLFSKLFQWQQPQGLQQIVLPSGQLFTSVTVVFCLYRGAVLVQRGD